MSKVEVNQISSQCGSTLTIGQSGDTVTLAAGATQSGFGRTGTVDWDTTAKTASFTAVSGNGYFVNTTSGAVTVTLPATPSAGDIVAVADYASTSNTNNITIARNGSNINGSASDIILSINGKSITLVYVDGTQGWKITDNADQSTEGASYITATGGTVTCCGDYKIHTFTGPGTFTVTCAGNSVGSNTVDYLVVAGGGSGVHYAGGGGAGGYRESSGAASGSYASSPLGAGVSALPVTATGYPITVGGGGAGKPFSHPTNTGTSGSNSVFSTITSAGGGTGGGYLVPPAPNTCSSVVGSPGGSGGGGGTLSVPSGSTPGATPALGGTGNTPPVSPPQGNNGGSGDSDNASWRSGGGGGGAGATGSDFTPGPSGKGGAGGNGVTSSINATPTARSGGGGGGTNLNPGAIPGGTGGGGAGAGAEGSGGNGTTNTGGGGGGAGGAGTSGSGGSGIVIIRYKYQ